MHPTSQERTGRDLNFDLPNGQPLIRAVRNAHTRNVHVEGNGSVDFLNGDDPAGSGCGAFDGASKRVFSEMRLRRYRGDAQEHYRH